MQIYKMVFNKIIVTILALIWKNRCKCVFNMKIICRFEEICYICKSVQKNTEILVAQLLSNHHLDIF